MAVLTPVSSPVSAAWRAIPSSMLFLSSAISSGPPMSSPLIASVTNRVPSSERTFSARARPSRAPYGRPASGTSFPMLYMITLGWFTVLAHHGLDVGFPPIGKSQRVVELALGLRPHVEGLIDARVHRVDRTHVSMARLTGLWALLMALNPAAFRISIRRSSARSIAQAPSGPLSWWTHAPRRRIGSPLTRRPRTGIERQRSHAERRCLHIQSLIPVCQRDPAGVQVRVIRPPPVRSCHGEPVAHDCRLPRHRASRRAGLGDDRCHQRRGARPQRWQSTSCLSDCRHRSRRRPRQCHHRALGVVTCTPRGTTWIRPARSNQTLRWIPAPEYHRLSSCTRASTLISLCSPNRSNGSIGTTNSE